MARGFVLRPALSCSGATQRTVFGQRLFDVVHNIFGRDRGRHCDDGVAAACPAQLVLRDLEKLEVNQIG